jgi:hypothetical protein
MEYYKIYTLMYHSMFLKCFFMFQILCKILTAEMKNGLVVNLRMGHMRKTSLMMDHPEWIQMVLLNQTGKR